MRVRHVWAPLALAATLTLAGCAPESPTDVETALSAELTSDVSDLAGIAATGDYATALGMLDTVSAKVTDAAADGRISGSRLVSLQQALATVRADLDTLLAAASAATPAPAPSETATTENETVVDTPVEQAPVEQAPGEQAPAVDEPAPPEDKGPGKDDSGKGNGNGNGPGGKDKKK